jgi:hypothetical protein
MASKTFDIIDSSKIKSFSVEVTEQIDDKYLLEFLRTSIENKKNSTSEGKFYYHFIPTSLSYEIINFKENAKDSIPEPFVFIQECEIDTRELFITQSYFCVFDSKELILYKDIKNILQEDIQTYIEQLYKIKIDRVTIVDEKKYELIKNRFLSQAQKYTINFYSVKKENSFKIFLSFILFATIVFISFLYVSINTNLHTIVKNQNTTSYEKGYKKLLLIYKQSSKKPVSGSIEFFDYIVKYNIFIEKLNYKNSKLYIVLEDKNRKKLLNVISHYTNSIQVHSIEFDKRLGKYKMDIIIDVKK